MKLRLLASDTATAAPPNDADFLRSLAAGSVEAVATFYDRNHENVRVLARRLLGDDAAAEDVVQEVFAAFPKAVRRYRGYCELEGFLRAITVKKARSHLRATIRRRRLLERYSREERPGPRDPEQDAYRKELARRLYRALDRISPAHREAFVLCEVQGLATAQVAATLGIPEATVRTRLFHSRSKLRAYCSEEVTP